MRSSLLLHFSYKVGGLNSYHKRTFLMAVLYPEIVNNFSLLVVDVNFGAAAECFSLDNNVKTLKNETLSITTGGLMRSLTVDYDSIDTTISPDSPIHGHYTLFHLATCTHTRPSKKDGCDSGMSCIRRFAFWAAISVFQMWKRRRRLDSVEAYSHYTPFFYALEYVTIM